MTLNNEHMQSLMDRDTWWHLVRYDHVRHILHVSHQKDAIVELGSGGGGLLRYLTRHGHSIQGFDHHPMALSNLSILPLELENDFSLPHTSSAIIALDVMEHLHRDDSFLKRCFHNLRAQGSLILTVPAHPSLFSYWDEQLGHHRRYTRAQITQLAMQAGFRIRLCSHLFSFLIIPAFLRKLFPNKKEHAFPTFNPVVHALMIGLGKIEQIMIHMGLRLPLGTSILLWAEKP